MKVKVRAVGNREPKPVYIEGEFIKLESLIKFAGLTQTGGEAKIAVLEGRVSVNGETALQRGKKIHPGDVVRYENTELKVLASGGEQQHDGQ